MSPGLAPRSAWWAVFAWVVVILTSVPLARALQHWVKATVGRQAYLVVVLLAVAVAVVAGAVASWRRLGRLSWRRMPWLLSSGGLCAAYSWHLRHAPEEALHFIEYGVLGLLLVRALRFRLADAALFPAALLIGTMVGVLDELVQWFVPGRFWDVRDIAVNALGIFLALVALAGGMRPPELSRMPAARSVRRLCGLAASLVLILALALSNTPPRSLALFRFLPFLDYMVDYGTVMTEYGHLHQVPGVGALYSRLSWDELREQDATRAPEVARILDGYPSNDDYKLFLRDYPPFGDSFTHELRVHLFRRDRYLHRLAHEEPSPSERTRMATTAWREDGLLRACCGATLAASSYALPEETWEPLEPWLDREAPYRSAVSRHLKVGFRVGHAWVLAFLLWGVLGLVAWRWGRERGAPTA